MRSGDKVAEKLQQAIIDTPGIKDLYKRDMYKNNRALGLVESSLRIQRWRREAKGSGPRARCAAFYLSQVEGREVKPT